MVIHNFTVYNTDSLFSTAANYIWIRFHVIIISMHTPLLCPSVGLLYSVSWNTFHCLEACLRRERDTQVIDVRIFLHIQSHTLLQFVLSAALCTAYFARTCRRRERTSRCNTLRTLTSVFTRTQLQGLICFFYMSQRDQHKHLAIFYSKMQNKNRAAKQSKHLPVQTSEYQHFY